MIGAIAGDIIGSIYERYPIKTKDFPLFDWRSRFTDDTVLTVAVADAIMSGGAYGEHFRNYYLRYLDAGYGSTFSAWARSGEMTPYGSFGNGSAMRVSPVGFAFDDIDSVLTEARSTAEVTHNHPEGIKGAQAVAAAVFLNRKNKSKEALRAFVQTEFAYDLTGTLEQLRPEYKFDISCQGTVPAALLCFLESADWEDAVRNAVSLGGDSDTLACITGAIAEAYYGGVPRFIETEVRSRLDDRLRSTVDQFAAFLGKRSRGGR